MLTVRKIFESELIDRDVPFQGPDSEGLYLVTVSNTEITVNLENIARNYTRDQDRELVVGFVEHVLSSVQATPSWEKAQHQLYFSAEPSDYDFEGTLHSPVTPFVTKLLVLIDEEYGKVTWVTFTMLDEWKISPQHAEDRARHNMSQLLQNVELQVKERDGMKLGMVAIPGVFKASIIFSPAFKAFVSPDMGWPVYAVIPCRDFMYIVPEGDTDLLNRIGTVVQREYRTSGYPITTEVLKISDNGIEAIGKYPE